MKLLFDQNLSAKLVALLAEQFPESAHVKDHNLERAADDQVWAFAARKGYVIVSKDDDFHQRSFLLGPPPKVVCIQLGNCTTAEVAACLIRQTDALQAFENDEQAAFLIVR